MTTLTDPPDNPADPLYVRRCAEVLKAVGAEAAVRGLEPDLLAA
jgi:hypothetical protein